MKTFEDTLAEWQAIKTQARQMAEQEKMLRTVLFEAAVKNPKEGVNTLELTDGRILKFTHKLNRKVSDMDRLVEDLANAGVNDVDQYAVPKRTLSVAAYKSATGPARVVLDKYVTTTPGLCDLEIK